MITIHLKENRAFLKTVEEIKKNESFISINDIYSYLIMKGIKHSLVRNKIVDAVTIPVEIKNQIWKIEDEVDKETEDIKIKVLNDTDAQHEAELTPMQMLYAPEE